MTRQQRYISNNQYTRELRYF